MSFWLISNQIYNVEFNFDQENDILRATLQQVQEQLETVTGTQESQRKVLETLNSQLTQKIRDLTNIREELSTVLQT